MLKRIKWPLVLVLIAVVALGVQSTQLAWSDAPPTPDSLLNDADRQAFDSLPQVVKNSLEQRFIPDLVTKGLSQQDMKDFLAAVVQAESQSTIRAGDGATGIRTRDTDDDNYFDCNRYPTLVYSIGAGIGTYSSITCEENVNALTASVNTWHATDGYNGDAHTQHDVTFSSVWDYRPYYSGKWNFCGEFTASVNQQPTPQPSTGRKCKLHVQVP